MKLLIDSHVLIWYLVNDDRLPQSVKDLLEDPQTSVVVSVATLWELMVKALAGRLGLPDAPERFLTVPIHEAGFRQLSLEPRHVLSLPDVHGDPFDRMLVAQAVAEDMSVVTGDPAFAQYPVDVVW